MAKNKRRTGKARPITSHQLFPAVVALWFGALFGLGSLAIRPSLIEQAVVASKIDLIIPAAAPPLGVTARILIALVLSALGALIGTLIARHIARPKQEVRQRKRGAANLDAETDAPRLDGSVIEPAVRQPILAHEELGEEGFDAAEFAEVAEPQVALAGRRRALAIDHDDEDFVPYDSAPLPGGSIQILDVGGAEFETAAAESQAQPLDLTGFSESQAKPILSGPILSGNGVPDAVTAPMTPAAGDSPAPGRQVFQPLQIEPGNSVDSGLAALAAESVSPFEDHEAADSRQIFGMPVVDGAVPREAVKAAGYQVSVFDVPEPEPLFSRPAQPDGVAEPSEPTAAAAPCDERLPPLASLAIDDLAARLAESMRRRRVAREAAAMAAAAEPVAEQIASDPAAEPELAAPAEPEAKAEPEAAGSLPPPRFDPFANLPPIVLPEEPVEPAPAATLAMPAALRPLQLDETCDDDPLDSLLPPRLVVAPPAPAGLQAEPEAVAPAVPESFPVPAEDTDPPLAETSDRDAAEAEEDNYGSLLELGQISTASPFVRIEEPEEAGQAAEPVVIFPGQASRPAAIAAQFAPPASFAAPVPPAPAVSDAGEVASFRRFDAPAQAGQGQPVAAAPTPGPALDPVETERALRSALASLQRMSGAA